MARIDDYKNAVQLGKKELASRNPKRIASLSGAEFNADSEGKGFLRLDFL